MIYLSIERVRELRTWVNSCSTFPANIVFTLLDLLDGRARPGEMSISNTEIMDMISWLDTAPFLMGKLTENDIAIREKIIALIMRELCAGGQAIMGRPGEIELDKH